MVRLLDLFCGAGGASMGYHRAGFEVEGVDITPQPRYPFRFHQGDALEYVARHGHEYDVIAASPPCQAHSVLRHCNTVDYLELIPDTRRLLVASGKPYVIENVVGAPLHSPIVLCGTMFNRPVYRHRLFESSKILSVPAHSKHLEPTTSGHGKTRVGARYSHFESSCDYTAPAASFRRAIGCEWMTGLEAAQSIPPVYTEYIGRQLLIVNQDVDKNVDNPLANDQHS